MTESQWLTCDVPARMSDHLFGTVSERKLALLGCACCRRISNPQTPPCLEQVVGFAEDVAEGRGKRERLVTLAQTAQTEQERFRPDTPEYLLFTGVTCVAW